MNESKAIRQLYKIFKEKEWFNKDEEDFVYESFCDLMEILQPDERELLLELTHRYIWVSGKEYEDNLKDALSNVAPELLKDITQLYLFPIIKPTDEGKAKSGTSLVYDLKAMMPMINRYRNLKHIALDNFSAFNNSPGSKKNELLCLVDDFIGTGDTLDQCLTEISNRMKIDYSKIFIVSISCQKDTYDKLITKGIRIFSKYIIQRGISDHNIQPAIDEKKALMRSIEKSIPGSSSFSLGWQESEAVVTLKRTPDNTFPIFWKKIKRNGKLYNAPFLRLDN